MTYGEGSYVGVVTNLHTSGMFVISHEFSLQTTQSGFNTGTVTHVTVDAWMDEARQDSLFKKLTIAQDSSYLVRVDYVKPMPWDPSVVFRGEQPLYVKDVTVVRKVGAANNLRQ
jgi:hypothetical protein